MKVAKQKRYSFHPRVGRDKCRKSNVIVYKGVNLKHPLDFGDVQWRPDGVEVCAMISKVHSTNPIVVSIGVKSSNVS